LTVHGTIIAVQLSIVELIDCENGKIVGFEIVCPSTRLNPGNYRRVASGIECVGVERMLIR
jgi:hypothetical protein